MSTIKITVPATIVTDEKYCGTIDKCPQLTLPETRTRFNQHECRAFEKELEVCLGGGPLRCAACLEAGQRAKESFTAGSAEEVERTPGQPHPYRIVKGCDCGYCNEQREKAKEMKL